MTRKHWSSSEIRAAVHEYVGAAMHDEATDRQVVEMEELLRESEEARQLYADLIEVSVQLPRVLAGVLAENDACGRGDDERQAAWDDSDSRNEVGEECSAFSDQRWSTPLPPVIVPTRAASLFSLPSFVGGAVFSYLMAAVIVGVGLMLAASWKLPDNMQVVRQSEPCPSPLAAHASIVGQVTGLVDCQWADPATETFEGASVALGRRYALSSGLIEISYDSGAKVLLQGPTTYIVESDASGYLAVGKLTAKLEKRGEARGERGENLAGNASSRRSSLSTIHHPLSTASSPQSPIPNPSLPTTHYPLFTIKTPTAIVTDLGTEFGVEVDSFGATQSHVFRGTVRVELIGRDGRPFGDARVLHANESAKVDPSGENRTVVFTPSVDPAKFVRELPEQTVKAVDLVDIVAGGNGYSGLRDRGIDPRTGRIVTYALSQTMPGRVSVAAANLLQKTKAAASSEYSSDHRASNAVDGLTQEGGMTDWVSDFRKDSNPRLAISGFNSAIHTIRLWGDDDIVVKSVAIRSSTHDQQSLAAQDYETVLVPRTDCADMSRWTFLGEDSVDGSYYMDFVVHAPAGTKSLLFDFGAAEWIRVQEVQAFAGAAPMAERIGDGSYHRVDESPMIDGVFVPGPDPVAVQIDSTGRTFDEFGVSADQSPFFVWAFGKRPMQQGPKTVWGGVDYASSGHGLLSMPANKGITFDLDAIRRANPGWRVLRFRAVAGNADPGETVPAQPETASAKPKTASADLWVLVDGKLRFRRREINGYSGLVPIVLAIEPTDRFLTLAATDGGNGVLRDWIVFGDPVLDMLSDWKRPAQGKSP